MFRQNRRIGGGGIPACIVPFNSCKSKSNLRKFFISAVILSEFFIQKFVSFVPMLGCRLVQNCYKFIGNQVGDVPLKTAEFCAVSVNLSI